MCMHFLLVLVIGYFQLYANESKIRNEQKMLKSMVEVELRGKNG